MDRVIGGKTLREILDLHRQWVADPNTGEKANLSGANLYLANLRWANLRSANLREANLQKANLRGADLRSANLSGADLREADLRSANLRLANLQGADLRGADLDFSSGIPLHCGGKDIILCDKLLAQVLYHAFAQSNPNVERLLTQEIRDFVNTNAHREEIGYEQ